MLPTNIRDDESYEIVNSGWLAELNELGAAESHHRHYKLCFNAQGILDVISDVPETAKQGADFGELSRVAVDLRA